jgi:hypothetical protein
MCAGVSTDACGHVTLGAERKERRKMKLSEHAYEDHRVGWDEARTLEIESYTRYGEYSYPSFYKHLIHKFSL